MIKKTTLDILDAALQEAYDARVGLDPELHHKIFSREVVISPKYWSDYYPPEVTKLKWKEVRYSNLGKHLAGVKSKKTGIYYFFTRPDALLKQRPQFVFYVGIAGEHGSGRSLVERLGDYLHLETVKKRHKVHTALKLYYPTVWVAYALTKMDHKKIEKLEEALHGFFYPWANGRDFPAALKAASRAWK